MDRIIGLSEYYSELRARKDDLKAQLSELEKDLKGVEVDLISAMTDAEMQNFKRADGTQFIVVNKSYPSAIPETKQELYEVLREQGYEDLFTINTQTLSSSIRQWREESEWDEDKATLTELIDPYIRVEERASISMRKGK